MCYAITMALEKIDQSFLVELILYFQQLHKHKGGKVQQEFEISTISCTYGELVNLNLKGGHLVND